MANWRLVQFVIKHDPPIHFEVHHKNYVKGALPWDYPDSWLTTLCNECHNEIHFSLNTNEHEIVKVYTDFSKRQEYIAPKCIRCNGNGYIEEYKHVSSGICFNCWGYGIKWD